MHILFSSVQRWSPSSVSKLRKVWLRVLGLPLHVRDEKCFKHLASLFGEFVDFDEESITFMRVDLARICVNTSTFSLINEKLRLEVMGTFFDVWVVEEAELAAWPTKRTSSGWEEGSSASSKCDGGGVFLQKEVEEEGDVSTRGECSVRKSIGMGSDSNILSLMQRNNMECTERQMTEVWETRDHEDSAFEVGGGAWQMGPAEDHHADVDLVNVGLAKVVNLNEKEAVVGYADPKACEDRETMDTEDAFVGPTTNSTSFGPMVVFQDVNHAENSNTAAVQTEGVVRVNSHVRFVDDESDYSDFNDSVGDAREEIERKVLQKIKRKNRKKQGSGKMIPMGNSSLTNTVEVVRGSRGKGKKNAKGCVPSAHGQPDVEGADIKLKGVQTDNVASPGSGLRLILDEEDGTQVPDTPLMRKGVDPLKKLEASSLYGIQNDLGFTYTTPAVVNTDRMENMEVVDVEKKVIRENRVVDQ